MILKRLVRSFLKGVRRVNQKALHAGKGKSIAKAKPAAAKARTVAASKAKDVASKAKHVATKAKHVKKTASKVKSKVQASVKAKAQAAQLKAKAKAKSQEPEFKRTSVNPLSAMQIDPAHSPGHRKMNWKKYQETAKMSRKAIRP